MASENSVNWRNSALEGFAELDPDRDEIREVGACLDEVAAGTAEKTRIPFDFPREPQYLVKCGRFGIVYCSESEDLEVVDVVLWEKWYE